MGQSARTVEVLAAFERVVIEAVAGDGKIQLPGFLTFDRTERKAPTGTSGYRRGDNPSRDRAACKGGQVVQGRRRHLSRPPRSAACGRPVAAAPKRCKYLDEPLSGDARRVVRSRVLPGFFRRRARLLAHGSGSVLIGQAGQVLHCREVEEGRNGQGD